MDIEITKLPKFRFGVVIQEMKSGGKIILLEGNLPSRCVAVAFISHRICYVRRARNPSAGNKFTGETLEMLESFKALYRWAFDQVIEDFDGIEQLTFTC